jgi:hypothetical protein
MEDNNVIVEDTALIDVNEDDEDIIDSTPEYSPKSEFNKAVQVGGAFLACVNARGTEMKSAYWNTKLTKTGEAVKTYYPDARKIYIARVQTLKIILNPEINRDDITKKAIKRLVEEETKLILYYGYRDKELVSVKDPVTGQDKGLWKDTGKIIIPEVDAVVTVANPVKPGSSVTNSGLWNKNINKYYDELVLVYDKIFQELNDLIDRLNYFKSALNYG